MASPEAIKQALPETLPEDFSEWDRGVRAAAHPADSHSFETVADAGAAMKPPAQLVKPQVAVSHKDDRLRNSAPPKPPTPATPATPHAVDEFLFQSFQPKKVARGVQHRKSKKRIIWISSAAVSVLLLLAVIPIFYPSLLPGRTSGKSSIATQPGLTDARLATNTLKPSPSTPLMGSSQLATNTPKPSTTTDSTPNITDAEGATPPQGQSKSPSDPLNAAAQIPQDTKAGTEKAASSTSGSGVTDKEAAGGSEGGANDSNAASSNSGPKTKAELPKKMNISSSVAEGMLLKKTDPLYPPDAKDAHVLGTVVLQVTISKEGAIQNPTAISGPALLQQAAVDAVKSWRYKPYVLNGEAVEVETTVSVAFTNSDG
jgi:TonB family protein